LPGLQEAVKAVQRWKQKGQVIRYWLLFSSRLNDLVGARFRPSAESATRRQRPEKNPTQSGRGFISSTAIEKSNPNNE
jgi:hypothetical protein